MPRFREYGSNQDRENYEALLNLAERLGDAKPKGLVKSGKRYIGLKEYLNVTVMFNEALFG